MLNKVMERLLQTGEALDVRKVGHPLPNSSGLFVLDEYIDDVDYCDAQNEEWIWSIGRRKSGPHAGVIYASTSTQFYQHPEYTCLWLR